MKLLGLHKCIMIIDCHKTRREKRPASSLMRGIAKSRISEAKQIITICRTTISRNKTQNTDSHMQTVEKLADTIDFIIRLKGGFQAPQAALKSRDNRSTPFENQSYSLLNPAEGYSISGSIQAGQKPALRRSVLKLLCYQ